MSHFLNHYHCPHCRHSWASSGGSAADDRCPNCNLKAVPPYRSDPYSPQVEEPLIRIEHLPPRSEMWDVEYTGYIFTNEDNLITATQVVTGETAIEEGGDITSAIDAAEARVHRELVKQADQLTNACAIEVVIDAATRRPEGADRSRAQLLQGVRNTLDSLGFGVPAINPDGTVNDTAVNGGDTVEAMDAIYPELVPWTKAEVEAGGEPEPDDTPTPPV